MQGVTQLQAHRLQIPASMHYSFLHISHQFWIKLQSQPQGFVLSQLSSLPQVPSLALLE